MNPHLGSQTTLHNPSWFGEKTTPLPATSGYYRSRIYSSNVNINPLIAACDQLLSLVPILKTARLPEDHIKLLEDLAHEIRSFEHRAQIANYPPHIIVAARYAICALLDETISQTPLGQQNNWAAKNLLAIFFQEDHNGERFFAIIDQALGDIASNLHLIELLYLCLTLGFVGSKQNPHELLAITNKLYQISGQYGHRNCKNIMVQSDNLRTTTSENTAPATSIIAINTTKLFGAAIIFAILTSGLIYLGINIGLSHLSKPIYNALTALQTNKSGSTL